MFKNSDIDAAITLVSFVAAGIIVLALVVRAVCPRAEKN